MVSWLFHVYVLLEKVQTTTYNLERFITSVSLYKNHRWSQLRKTRDSGGYRNGGGQKRGRGNARHVTKQQSLGQGLQINRGDTRPRGELWNWVTGRRGAVAATHMSYVARGAWPRECVGVAWVIQSNDSSQARSVRSSSTFTGKACSYVFVMSLETQKNSV